MIGSGLTCYLCGGRAEHRHHCMHGTANRKKADKYDLTVMLCLNCHTLLHDKGLHDLELKQKAQEVFEAEHGHELWMKEFGKNYL